MEIIAKTEQSDIATVYIAKCDNNKYIEFVESSQPPLKKEDKWVLIISTLFGCPVKCGFCDCGGSYSGKLSAEEILGQIAFLVNERYKSNILTTQRLKIQFSRMGEPSFNRGVLEAIKQLQERFIVKSIVPSLSSVAPVSSKSFFEELLTIKKELYDREFQLQFSIHTTDLTLRDKLVPVKKWSFAEMTAYAERFYSDGGKKVSLNFALGKDHPIDAGVLANSFPPELFLIKLTPVNPTFASLRNHIESFAFDVEETKTHLSKLNDKGFEVIVSIGDREENQIGSNCGQFIKALFDEGNTSINAYSYKLERTAG